MHSSKPNNKILSETHPALRKVQRLGQLMRALSAGYATWVLWKILHWWTDTERVLNGYGNYIERDVSATASWQRMGPLALDLGAWVLLCLAVVHCWKFLRHVSQPPTTFHLASVHLSRCAWYALTCQVISVLIRPIQSYLMSMHLAVANHVWKWSFQPVDLLAFLFCLALLMFAYVFSWTMEMAEENRSFV